MFGSFLINCHFTIWCLFACFPFELHLNIFWSAAAPFKHLTIRDLKENTEELLHFAPCLHLPTSRLWAQRPLGSEMMQRRRATKDELKQGAEEIRQADARMRTEAAALGEEPIEDVKVDEGKPEQVMESLEDGPQQVERYVEEPPKNSPEVATPRSRPGVPSTPPPPHPP